MSVKRATVRIAAMGDMHCGRGSVGQFRPVFAQVPGLADVLVLCGDLTNYGLPDEAKLLTDELAAAAPLPIVAVLGNHDYEAGKQDEIVEILSRAGVTILDGEAHEVLGIGFAGVKGFVGGFGRRTLEPWGEAAIKNLVQVAMQEALKLESALAKLRTAQRIAILHYAPIQGTVEGEPPEIFPFLGSSRLEEPLNRYRVAAAFHGHAHRGAPEAKTSAGRPVYNVALSLLQRTYPDKPPFRVIEVPVHQLANE